MCGCSPDMYTVGTVKRLQESSPQDKNLELTLTWLGLRAMETLPPEENGIL